MRFQVHSFLKPALEYKHKSSLVVTFKTVFRITQILCCIEQWNDKFTSIENIINSKKQTSKFGRRRMLGDSWTHTWAIRIGALRENFGEYLCLIRWRNSRFTSVETNINNPREPSVWEEIDSLVYYHYLMLHIQEPFCSNNGLSELGLKCRRFTLLIKTKEVTSTCYGSCRNSEGPWILMQIDLISDLLTEGILPCCHILHNIQGEQIKVPCT